MNSTPRTRSNTPFLAQMFRMCQVEYAITDVDIKAKLALRGNAADKQELKDRATKHQARRA
jgi:hypothetical protein